MSNELTQEKIDHLQTKIALYQTQGQLISVLARQAQAEIDGLRAQLPKEPTNSKAKQGQKAAEPA